jgi:chemotaxis receptor (MCP) glutamine deamidase CheD
MKKTFHQGLRVTLLLVILLFTLGTENIQTVYAADAATNDNIGDAIVITGLTYTKTFDTTQAANDDPYIAPTRGPCTGTKPPNSNLNEGYKSLWYTYTPLANESIQADTFGSYPLDAPDQDFDTYIVIWKKVGGTAGAPTLELVGCNDDTYGVVSRLTFVGIQGTTYYFEIAQYNGVVGSSLPYDPTNANLVFNVNITNTDVFIGSTLMNRYYVSPGNAQLDSYNVSGGPMKVQSVNPAKNVASIRLQSYVSNTLYSYIETMGVPEGLLSHKYYFPTYNNTWAPLNSQIRFGNLNAAATTIRVTIGGVNVWQESVPGLEERRLYFNVSGGPVVIESLDPTKKIVAAIRLQSMTPSALYSFAETIGIPDEQLSHKYYFPTYNNTWGPLNSQIRFGNLNDTATTIRVTIGGVIEWEESVPGLQERRLYFDVSGGPVVIESLDPAKKIVAAIRLQSMTPSALYSFVETMGVPEGLLSHKYYFPIYNNLWAPLNSQIRFGNLNGTATTIRVTIGGVNVWEESVPGLQERRLYFDVSDGPVVIESLDPLKKIVAAIRLQSMTPSALYSFSELMGVPDEKLSNINYFPTYNNTWGPLTSEIRFGSP